MSKAMSKGGGACECPRVGVFFNFLEGGWRHTGNVQGWWCLWMSKSGCVFQFFGGRMTSHGQCPRVVVLVNVQEWVCFSIFWRADDVTRTMSKGGGGFTPPSGNPVSAPARYIYFWVWGMTMPWVVKGRLSSVLTVRYCDFFGWTFILSGAVAESRRFSSMASREVASRTVSSMNNNVWVSCRNPSGP